MRRVLRWLGIGVLAGVAGLGVVALWARFVAGGPVGPFPAGALAGDVAESPPADWGFLADRETVALQVAPEAPRAVTTWVVVHEGRPVIPAGTPTYKTWPELAMDDPRVVLRADGRLYPLRAERVRDPETLEALSVALESKYGAVASTRDYETGIWFFRLLPRHAGAAGTGGR